MLVAIESGADFGESIVEIDPIDGQLTELATLDFNIGSIGGMAILNGTGYFTSSSGGGENALFSFDVFTGATQKIGDLPESLAFGNLAVAPVAVPEASSLPLMAGLALLIKARRRRGLKDQN